MDALTRYHRMAGFNTLWLPGTDHAGIATQIVVERQLEAQGSSRAAIGRDAFNAKVWEWKEFSGGTILKQMRRLGDSVDWSRTYFTMDEKLSNVVVETFVQLYEQGLIYRGKRLVNWDPKLQTAVSDLEVETEEEDGKLWEIRYPAVDGADDPSSGVVVATTRPETHARRRRRRGASGGRALHVPARQAGHAATHRPHDPGDRRCHGGPRIRHRLREDHARARLQRLRGRQAPPPRADPDLHADGDHQRQRAVQVPRPRPLRRPQARARGPARRRPRGLREAAQDDGAALRTHRRDRRADAVRAVVHGDEQAGARRHAASRPVDRAGRARRRCPRRRAALSRAVARGLQPVAGEHPGLVHLAPVVVGSPDPRVVRRARQHLRRAQRSRGAGQSEGRRKHRCADARPGRARHLVFVGDGAVLDTGLAAAAGSGQARVRPVPAFDRIGDRLRHHLLLGRPDDHDDDALHRPRAVPQRLHPRHRARRRGQEDVQERGQYARPDRHHRRHRPRRAGEEEHQRAAPPRGRAPGREQGEASTFRPASPRTGPMRCVSPWRPMRRSAATSTST